MNTKRQEDKNVVVLDCEDLTSSIVTKDTVFGVIHKQLLDKLTEQICESVWREKQRRGKGSTEQNINDLRKNDNFPLNYYIAGKRGSGKTTFLHQIEEKLKYNDYNDTKIKFLHRYEPSQSFGVPNDLFITVTAAVKTRMRKLACEPDRQKEYNSNRYRFCEEKLDKLDKAIVRFSCERKALSGMSEYRASALCSEDPEMNNNIRENFRESMKLLCELEEVDAFVLVIDDVDIRTKQCCNVLKDLRLFLSNDYLIILMAGDRENNLEHVREGFFKEYDIEYHRADKQGKEARMESIASHAAQYFAKLFPVGQQFELGSLYTLIQNSVEYRLKYRDYGRDEMPLLQDWLKIVFGVAISPERSEAEAYVNSFISLPLRNIIQVLEYWVREGIWDVLNQLEANTEKNETEKIETERAKQGARQIEMLVRTGLNRSLHDQLSVSLKDYEALDLSDSRVYYSLLLRLWLETGNFEYEYSLLDEVGRNKKYQFLALVLSANFKRQVRDFKGFLMYLCYGPASIALYEKALGQFRAITTGEKSPLVAQTDIRRSFEKYLHIGNWQSASRWARHANMIWCYDPDRNYIHSGVIRIQDTKTVQKLNHYLSENQGKEHFMNVFSLIVSMNKSDGRDNSYYISIYSFIAFIFECVETCEQAFRGYKEASREKDDAKRRRYAKISLYKLVKRYFPIVPCKRPEWQLPLHQDEVEHRAIILVAYPDILFQRDPQCASSGFALEGTYLGGLLTEIIEWYEATEKDREDKWEIIDDISPQTMGRLWSNFYGLWRTVSHSQSHMFSGGSASSEEEKSNLILKSCKQIAKLVVKILSGRTLSTLKKDVDATDFYLACIGSFPLVKHLSENISNETQNIP